VLPEEKGVRYLSTHLTTYKEAELELKMGALSEGSWTVEGRLRVSPSQSFSVRASVAAGQPSEAVGILLGNKNRGAWFNARHEGGGVELSIGYRDATQKAVPVQAFLFKAEATTELVTPAKPVADADAALAETWSAKLRGTRISYSHNDRDSDYSGGGYYSEIHRDIFLYGDSTFGFREEGFTRVTIPRLYSPPTTKSRVLAGRWQVAARNGNIYLQLSGAEGESFLSAKTGRVLLNSQWAGVPLVSLRLTRKSSAHRQLKSPFTAKSEKRRCVDVLRFANRSCL
jgi:hypothetical protein